MHEWELVRDLRGRVGLEDGKRADREDAERLLDVVAGLTLEEEDVSTPFLYVYESGRGVICAPRGWTKRIGDHDALLEEIFHYLTVDYWDGVCTVWAAKHSHRREERRAGDCVLIWHFYHANLAGLSDEEMMESTGRSWEEVRRFRELQIG